MIKVEIDNHSGFCFGVTKAINAANDLLEKGVVLHCVGDIVHNEAESKRLNKLGMHIINYDEVNQITHGTILFRAHGEPPQSYQLVKKAGLNLHDATCPVVLKLQQRVKEAYAKAKAIDGQLLIFGKRGHAEVIGLEGQCDNDAIIIENKSEIGIIDMNRPIELFAQTTKDPEELKELVRLIEQQKGEPIQWHNTTCKQVTGRVPHMKNFAQRHDAIVFVGGKKSSNAKVLFSACLEVNQQSYMVSDASEIDFQWFRSEMKSVGVCGATSSPQWQMEEVADTIRKYFGLI